MGVLVVVIAFAVVVPIVENSSVEEEWEIVESCRRARRGVFPDLVITIIALVTVLPWL